MNDAVTNSPRESATTILMRDHQGQVEILMLRKNPKINYGGSWVFPGGVIDPEDRQHSDPEDELNAHKVAAIREAKEETDLDLEVNSLVPYSFWLTPKVQPKRFATWFFIADANGLDQPIQIDNQEIVDYRWFTPKEAIEDLEITLNGPSHVTLSELQNLSSAAEVAAFVEQRQPPIFEPKAIKTDKAFIAIYHGDHAYEHEEISLELVEKEGQKHRLYMHKDKAWEYYGA